MRYVKDKINCCGCTACSKVCPVNAIKMLRDDEGFAYPSIDEIKCINCGLCERVCRNHPIDKIAFNQQFFAAKAKDESVRVNSRSGGLFFEVAKRIISLGGCVYGAALIDNVVKHIRGTDLETCKLMQGSKYVESDLNNCYVEAANDLLFEKHVLFSGTACQIAGLYAYLSTKRGISLEKLITIDIVCHGVASAKLFDEYIFFMQKKYKGDICNFNFRDKSFGWNTHVESFNVGQTKIACRYWTNIFCSNESLRPSCGNCAFATYNRPGDITIADFWGLNKHYLARSPR